jgi:hypothetical protein
VVGNVATYFGAKRESATTVATVERQADVDIAKVNAENERLREQVRESERAKRQASYQGLLTVLNRMDMYGTGYPAEHERDYMAALEELNRHIAAFHLFSPQEVRDSIEPLAEALGEVGKRIAELARENPASPYQERFARAWAENRERLLRGEAHLTTAMRADVTKGIIDES